MSARKCAVAEYGAEKEARLCLEVVVGDAGSLVELRL